jgi:hypothetical protein
MVANSYLETKYNEAAVTILSELALKTKISKILPKNPISGQYFQPRSPEYNGERKQLDPDNRRV